MAKSKLLCGQDKIGEGETAINQVLANEKASGGGEKPTFWSDMSREDAKESLLFDYGEHLFNALDQILNGPPLTKEEIVDAAWEIMEMVLQDVEHIHSTLRKYYPDED